MSADSVMFATRSKENGTADGNSSSSSSSSSEGARRRDGLGRRGSGERPLSLDHQEMLSFADESDSEDGSSVLVSPSGNGSNGPNVMWKSCIASLPGDDHSTGPVLLRRSPSKTNGVAPERPQPPQTTSASGDVPPLPRQQDDARWNFLTASEEQPVPERPPRSSPSADMSTSTFTGISETKPSRQSPVMDAIHTTGPPPDLITSSERPKSDPSSPTKSKLEGGSPSPVPIMPEATRL
uniref:Rho GTPase-activating protein RICH2 n=1 Tax=Rhipicephalus zambeziensis TaxID=60191 RepID=A0A224YXZ1_9ACAR